MGNVNNLFLKAHTSAYNRKCKPPRPLSPPTPPPTHTHSRGTPPRNTTKRPQLKVPTGKPTPLLWSNPPPPSSAFIPPTPSSSRALPPPLDTASTFVGHSTSSLRTVILLDDCLSARTAAEDAYPMVPAGREGMYCRRGLSPQPLRMRGVLNGGWHGLPVGAIPTTGARVGGSPWVLLTVRRLSLAKPVGGVHNLWESPGSPCGATPARCTRPLGVVRLAMPQHSLTEPVQFSGHLVVTSGGCTPTLGSHRTRHAATLPHQAGQSSVQQRGDRGQLSRVSHEKVTTDGIKTTEVRALTQRSEL